MGSFRKISKFVIPIFLVSILCVAGVSATWRYAELPPEAPEDINIKPGIGVFDRIPGMGDEEEETGETGSNINALVQSFVSEQGLNHSTQDSQLINRIEDRFNRNPTRNTFGSMALTGGFSTNEELVGTTVSNNIEWIAKWDENVDGFSNLEQIELYSYDKHKYGSLGTNDEGVLWWAVEGLHYKHMQAAELIGENPYTAMQNLYDNYSMNNKEIGYTFGVIYKTILMKEEGTWTIVSNKPGHAKAGYYEENQSNNSAFTTHIPARNCDTWEECIDTCNHPEGSVQYENQ